MKQHWLLMLVAWLCASVHARASGGFVRLHAVGHKQLVPTNYSEFQTQFDALLPPPNSSAIGNVYVFGENAGLPTGLLGSRGRAARNQTSFVTAFGTLAVAYAPQVAYYLAAYPKLNPVNAIELALTDVMWRAFNSTFSAIARSRRSYVLACTITADLQTSTDPEAIAFFGDPDLRPSQTEVYLPTGPEVYNTAFLFAPDGSIIAKVRKSHLTADEISVLHLTPSPVSANRAIALPFARACVSICWDGFWPDVLRNLDAQGCALLLHPTWNNGVWQGDSQPGVWQAEDWISGPFGTVQPACKNLAVNVNAMITGNLFDMVVDGQSAIVARSAQTPKPLYAGTELSNSSVAANWTATVLAMAPWAIEDPGRAHPQYSLQQRRDILGAHAKLLLPDSGSPFENQYVASVVFADVPVSLLLPWDRELEVELEGKQ